ncbi:unnamed protein product [Parnassius apollo]|uniref:(apollo) hypothetical protein n=1 Tax=Parnassius apollo TaxID=110799 RepID=A0A8S3WA70_PARAO|nr:unnamed protein product [Parnassius apollo]
MQLKTKSVDDEDRPESPSGSLLLTNSKKVPPVRNGLRRTSGEISTIHEGHIQSYQNNVSKATLDLFNASNNNT